MSLRSMSFEDASHQRKINCTSIWDCRIWEAHHPQPTCNTLGAPTSDAMADERLALNPPAYLIKVKCR